MQKEITNLLELPNDYEYITNDIIKKFYTKNINKIIEDNTNIFSVFHYLDRTDHFDHCPYPADSHH